jgi:hexosaminidase
VGLAHHRIPDLGLRSPLRKESKNLSSPLVKSVFPFPQKATSLTGALELPAIRDWSLAEESFGSVIRFFQERIGLDERKDSQSSFLVIEKKEVPHPEGYRLRISPQGISLVSGQQTGIFRGLTTLAQLIEGEKESGRLSCIEIEDHPILARRGFMLDVSRCKVPTMGTILGLIDLLAELRFNEFQLYVEHTFAFSDHKTVWKDASPLTGEEIREIDQYCKERFIELVPNLNSFGHFERWLMHEPYKHLAECPDGFRRENPYIVRDHGTTLKPNQDSLDFIDSLYSEYLPNFSSDKFNVGMDEPWELGQGWSKDEIERRGKDKVYLDHLDGIRKLVEKHGKHMQFWADVLLEKPENASLLSPSASPIIWGYEADHPFPEQARGVSTCGLSYCLAPGTGTWRSFTGRWENAKANLESAVKNAIEHKADGVLLTSWGDCGNHQPWAVLYPPLVYAAQLCWNGKLLEDTQVIDATSHLIFGSESENPVKAILEIGKLDKIAGTQLPNTSLPWYLLFAPQVEKLEKYLTEHHKHRQLEEVLRFLNESRDMLPAKTLSPEGCLASEEATIGIELSIFAMEKALGIIRGQKPSKSIPPKTILDKYEKLWIARARPGGLSESMTILEEGLNQGT